MTLPEKTLTVKEHLRQARTLQIGIRGKRERIQELRELAESVTVPTDKDRVNGGPGEDRMSNVVACIVDFQSEVADDLQSLINLQRGIQRKINLCPNQKYRILLELYYLNGLTWSQVADRMNYGERNITKMHGKALQCIEEQERVPLNSVS